MEVEVGVGHRPRTVQDGVVVVGAAVDDDGLRAGLEVRRDGVDLVEGEADARSALFAVVELVDARCEVGAGAGAVLGDHDAPLRTALPGGEEGLVASAEGGEGEGRLGPDAGIARNAGVDVLRGTGLAEGDVEVDADERGRGGRTVENAVLLVPQAVDAVFPGGHVVADDHARLGGELQGVEPRAFDHALHRCAVPVAREDVERKRPAHVVLFGKRHVLHAVDGQRLPGGSEVGDDAVEFVRHRRERRVPVVNGVVVGAGAEVEPVVGNPEHHVAVVGLGGAGAAAQKTAVVGDVGERRDDFGLEPRHHGDAGVDVLRPGGLDVRDIEADALCRRLCRRVVGAGMGGRGEGGRE